MARRRNLKWIPSLPRPPATYRTGPGRPAPLPPSRGPAAASPRRVSAHATPPRARLRGASTQVRGRPALPVRFSTGNPPPSSPTHRLLGSGDARPTAPHRNWVATTSLKLIPASLPQLRRLATPTKVSQPLTAGGGLPISLSPIGGGGCLSTGPASTVPPPPPLVGQRRRQSSLSPTPAGRGDALGYRRAPGPAPGSAARALSGGALLLLLPLPLRRAPPPHPPPSLPHPSPAVASRAPARRLFAVSRSPRCCCLRRALARSAAAPGDR